MTASVNLFLEDVIPSLPHHLRLFHTLSSFDSCSLILPSVDTEQYVKSKRGSNASKRKNCLQLVVPPVPIKCSQSSCFPRVPCYGELESDSQQGHLWTGQTRELFSRLPSEDRILKYGFRWSSLAFCLSMELLGSEAAQESSELSL